MAEDLFDVEGNFFRSSTVLRNEFNKSVEHFRFRDFKEALNHLMRHMVKEYHRDTKTDIEKINKSLRRELYGRTAATAGVHAADLHAAAER